jgi:hypothetical protein
VRYQTAPHPGGDSLFRICVLSWCFLSLDSFSRRSLLLWERFEAPGVSGVPNQFPDLKRSRFGDAAGRLPDISVGTDGAARVPTRERGRGIHTATN